MAPWKIEQERPACATGVFASGKRVCHWRFRQWKLLVNPASRKIAA
jgi:hypothetical protein